MKKVKFFSNVKMATLENEVNAFIKDKDVVSVTYTTNTLSNVTYHWFCVLYSE